MTAQLYTKLCYRRSGDTNWQFVEETYQASGVSPAIVSPVHGSQLASGISTFEWLDNGSGATNFWLYAGSAPGAKDYFNSGALGTATTAPAGGQPSDGSSQIHVRLYYRIGGGPWLYVDEVNAAGSTVGEPASLIGSQPGSTLSGSNETFSWDGSSTGAASYWFYAGATQIGAQFANQSMGAQTRVALDGLPLDGSDVWIRLW